MKKLIDFETLCEIIHLQCDPNCDGLINHCPIWNSLPDAVEKPIACSDRLPVHVEDYFANITAEFPEKPTEEQRTSGKLISEKQAGLLFDLCKKSNVDPKNVAYYCQKPSLYWLTWDNMNKKYFNTILKTVQEQPRFFDKYQPVEKPLSWADTH